MNELQFRVLEVAEINLNCDNFSGSKKLAQFYADIFNLRRNFGIVFAIMPLSKGPIFSSIFSVFRLTGGNA